MIRETIQTDRIASSQRLKVRPLPLSALRRSYIAHVLPLASLPSRSTPLSPSSASDSMIILFALSLAACFVFFFCLYSCLIFHLSFPTPLSFLLTMFLRSKKKEYSLIFLLFLITNLSPITMLFHPV